MKNPFAMMALLAAAMTAAWRENKFRDAGIALPSAGRMSRGPVGKANPAGSKTILRFYRARHGHKAESVEEARSWYANYLRDGDARVREADACRQRARAARRAPPLQLAA